MAVVFDTLVRTLKIIYPKVTYVSNITDIDDKIIEAANEQNVAMSSITEKYTEISVSYTHLTLPTKRIV